MSVSGAERGARKVSETDDLARSGGRAFGSANGAEGPEGPVGPQGPAGSEIPIARGVAEVTFSSSAFSNEVTVTHGLGTTPTAIAFGPVKSGSIFVIPNIIGTPGSTTFKIQATVSGGTLNTNVKIQWIAC